MAAERSPEFEEWVERARSVDLLEAARAAGAQLKRQGSEHVGPCPACGGTDRFAIHPKKGVFNCGHQGGPGGDVIAMIQHVKGLAFVSACEELTGEPPPSGKASTPPDPAAERERREERRDRDLRRAAEDAAARERKMSAAERLWEACEPFASSRADAYMRRRRIVVTSEQSVALRFCPSLAYQGYANEDASEEVELGSFPAMVAAIRDAEGRLIGAHRTYLDPSEPAKLVPPGHRKRNSAKKVLGTAKGGAIWLGPVGAAAAIGEGIETVLSWHNLGVGPEEITPVAAVSLGNLAGGATGTVRHPKRPNRVIPNGEPDMESPGIRLPEAVRDLVLLGDGDSDPAWTRAMLVTAGRRFRAEGRVVAVHMAPEGQDWGDVYMRGEP